MVQSFEVTYDPDKAARAERAFYVRSVLELRRPSTFGPPVAFTVFVAGGLLLGAPAWFVAFFAVWLALSVLGPVFFYLARPLAAKRLALAHPKRQIKLTQQSIMFGNVNGQSANIEWSRIKHVWETSDDFLLVLGKFAAISIPKRSLPEGAGESIRASVRDAGQRPIT